MFDKQQRHKAAVHPYFWLLAVLLLVCYSLPLLYYYMQFHKLGHGVFITKRKGTILHVTIIVSLIQIVIYKPTEMILYGIVHGHHHDNDNKNNSAKMIAELVSNQIYALFANTLPYLILWRILMIWYEYNEVKALHHQKWTQYLLKNKKKSVMSLLVASLSASSSSSSPTSLAILLQRQNDNTEIRKKKRNKNIKNKEKSLKYIDSKLKTILGPKRIRI